METRLDWITQVFYDTDKRFGNEWDIPYTIALLILHQMDEHNATHRGKPGGLGALMGYGSGDYHNAIENIAKKTIDRYGSI